MKHKYCLYCGQTNPRGEKYCCPACRHNHRDPQPQPAAEDWETVTKSCRAVEDGGRDGR